MPDFQCDPLRERAGSLLCYPQVLIVGSMRSPTSNE